MTRIRVLLVDDHPVVRAGLRALLGQHPELEVVGDAGTGEEALALADTTECDVVLCDLRLGDGIDGVAVTRAFRGRAEPPAVVILTTFDRDVEVLRAVEAGAAGYLLKDAAPETILAAIKDAAAGRLVLADDLAHRVVEGLRRPQTRLTQRELDVLRLLATGASNREIARVLFVTEATVKTHLVSMFGKLGVDSRTRAVAKARDAGYL